MKKTIIKTKNNIFNSANAISGWYKEKIHSKTYMPFIYTFVFIFFLVIAVFLNVYSMNGGRFTLKQSFFVLFNWNDMDSYHHSFSPSVTTIDPQEIKDFQAIQVSWYNIFATMLGGMGMALAAVATQSLTRNPIAEGSTLGLVQSGIFGLVFVVSFGFTSLLSRYISVIIFSGVGALLLLVFILFNKKNKGGMQKIILAGLAIGIIFKTITFFMKSGDADLNTLSYSYVLGGAESISANHLAIGHDLMPTYLIISASLIFGGLLVSIINIKGMNLLEIGDERAKNLGSSVKITRILDVLIILLVLPGAVIIVGNMAFLGLFSVHLARWFMRSRDYRKVLPMTVVFGILIASLGLQLTEHFPQINSGIWMTFIGAPYLIYIGIRGLK